MSSHIVHLICLQCYLVISYYVEVILRVLMEDILIHSEACGACTLIIHSENLKICLFLYACDETRPSSNIIVLNLVLNNGKVICYIVYYIK